MPVYKLIHASAAQKQAALDKVMPELMAIVEQYASQFNIPFVDVRTMLVNGLKRPDVQQKIAQVVDDALEAAENAPA